MTARRAHAVALALSAVLTVLFVVRLLRNYNAESFIDLRVYAGGVDAWLQEGSAYARTLVPEELVFTYPPFSLLVLLPLGLLPDEVAAVALVAVSMAGTAAILHLAVHASGLRRIGPVPVDAAELLGPVLWLEPVRNTVDYGQVNVVLTLLLLADAVAAPRRRRGVLSGIAAAVKVVPAFFVLHWLAARDRAAAVRMVAVAVAATLLGAALMPRDSYEYWTHTLFETGRVGNVWYTSNQSLRGMFTRVFGIGTTATLAWLAASAVVVAVVVVAARRQHNAARPLAAVTAVGIGSLLVAPISWSHHWVWLPVAAVALAATGRMRDRALALAVVAACAVAPHWLLPQEGQAELSWSPPQLLAGSLYPLVSLAVLAALVSGRDERQHEDAERQAVVVEEGLLVGDVEGQQHER